MPDQKLEEALRKLQEAQVEYTRRLQDVWDLWLKSYDEMNKQCLRAQDTMMVQVQKQWEEVQAQTAKQQAAEK